VDRQVGAQAPYTFHPLAIVIMLLGMFAIWRTPTDIFPNIRIPVVAAVWKYSGLSPDEMATRMILGSEPRADHRQRRRHTESPQSLATQRFLVT